MPDVRGEWTLTATSLAGTLHGKALITQEADAEGKFAAHTMKWEEVIEGTFTGTLEGSTATVRTTNAGAPPVLPEGEFNSKEMAVEVGTGTLALSGKGTLALSGVPPMEATLVATRIKSYQEIQERELKEKEQKEKEEKEAKEAREAREKLEKEEREALEAKEAKEKQEAQEVAERTAREQQEKAQHEKEAKERESREAQERAVIPKSLPITTTLPPLVSVGVTSKTLTLGHGNTMSLNITNPNASAVHGHLKLTLAKSGKTSSSKHISTLGEATFSITAHGSAIVKVKLSHSGRAELARLKTMHVVVTSTTEASGQSSISKTYSLTLHAAKAPAHGKH
jgi:flagellar biosynthesis GTPase FlhF